MVDKDSLSNGIFVYYKILRPGSLNSVSNYSCLDSYINNQTSSSYLKDSNDSEFMCTLVQSKNSVSVVDVLKFLGYPLDFSNYDIVFKVLVNLKDYFPDSVDLTHLVQLSESSHQKSAANLNNINKKNDSFNNSDKKHDDNNNNNLLNKAKTLNMDFLREKFDNLLGLGEKKKGHLVWIPVKLDDQLPSVDNNIYIKIYLLPKCSDNNTTSSTSTTTSTTKFSTQATHFDSTTTTTSNTHTSKPKELLQDLSNKTKLDDTLSSSDRDEINNLVNKWSKTNDGKLKDIRSLLSTLQNIVSTEVEWEPMPVTLLVGDKNKIKSYYRKALLAFHPDKQMDKSPKRKLLFELVVQTLMQSWNKSS